MIVATIGTADGRERRLSEWLAGTGCQTAQESAGTAVALQT